MFYVGQKVICIDNRDAPELVKGERYTVAGVTRPTVCAWRGRLAYFGGVYLREAKPDPSLRWRGFASIRFRPATSIDCFTSMLNNVPLHERAPA